MNNNSMEEVLTAIAAMRRQEEVCYGCTTDYLFEQCQRGSLLVDDLCRAQMAGWMFQIIDFCKFSRETASIAMSHLDRYLATPTGAQCLTDVKRFQLAAMTCLYTAVKIHEPEAMSLEIVSNFSRGTYTPDEIQEIEYSILSALQWRLNPPTALSFVRHFLELIPVIDKTTRQTVYDLAKYQTELACSDYKFVTVKASTIAFCALMNALESLNSMNDILLRQIWNALAQSLDYSLSDQQLLLAYQNSLYEAVVGQPNNTVSMSRPHSVVAAPKPKAARRSSFETSPCSIAAMR